MEAAVNAWEEDTTVHLSNEGSGNPQNELMTDPMIVDTGSIGVHLSSQRDESVVPNTSIEQDDILKAENSDKMDTSDELGERNVSDANNVPYENDVPALIDVPDENNSSNENDGPYANDVPHEEDVPDEKDVPDENDGHANDVLYANDLPDEKDVPDEPKHIPNEPKHIPNEPKHIPNDFDGNLVHGMVNGLVGGMVTGMISGVVNVQNDFVPNAPNEPGQKHMPSAVPFKFQASSSKLMGTTPMGTSPMGASPIGTTLIGTTPVGATPIPDAPADDRMPDGRGLDEPDEDCLNALDMLNDANYGKFVGDEHYGKAAVVGTIIEIKHAKTRFDGIPSKRKRQRGEVHTYELVEMDTGMLTDKQRAARDYYLRYGKRKDAKVPKPRTWTTRCRPYEKNSDPRFRCPTCQKFCAHKPALIIHMRRHTGEKPFKCRECDSSFISGSSLSNHVKQRHTPPDQIKIHRCDVCNSTFSFPAGLRHHKETHLPYDQRPKYRCLQNGCEKEFVSEGNMKKHFKKHSVPPFVPQKCEYCLKMMRSSRQMKDHITAHKRPILKCNKCGKTFKVRKRYESHLVGLGSAAARKCFSCGPCYYKKANCESGRPCSQCKHDNDAKHCVPLARYRELVKNKKVRKPRQKRLITGNSSGSENSSGGSLAGQHKKRNGRKKNKVGKKKRKNMKSSSDVDVSESEEYFPPPPRGLKRTKYDEGGVKKIEPVTAEVIVKVEPDGDRSDGDEEMDLKHDPASTDPLMVRRIMKRRELQQRVMKQEKMLGTPLSENSSNVSFLEGLGDGSGSPLLLSDIEGQIKEQAEEQEGEKGPEEGHGQEQDKKEEGDQGTRRKDEQVQQAKRRDGQHGGENDGGGGRNEAESQTAGKQEASESRRSEMEPKSKKLPGLEPEPLSKNSGLSSSPSKENSRELSAESRERSAFKSVQPSTRSDDSTAPLPPADSPTSSAVGPVVESTGGHAVEPAVAPAAQPAVEPAVAPTIELPALPGVGPGLRPTVGPTVGPAIGPVLGLVSSTPATSSGIEALSVLLPGAGGESQNSHHTPLSPIGFPMLSDNGSSPLVGNTCSPMSVERHMELRQHYPLPANLSAYLSANSPGTSALEFGTDRHMNATTCHVCLTRFQTPNMLAEHIRRDHFGSRGGLMSNPDPSASMSRDAELLNMISKAQPQPLSQPLSQPMSQPLSQPMSQHLSQLHVAQAHGQLNHPLSPVLPPMLVQHSHPNISQDPAGYADAYLASVTLKGVWKAVQGQQKKPGQN